MDRVSKRSKPSIESTVNDTLRDVFRRSVYEHDKNMGSLLGNATGQVFIAAASNGGPEMIHKLLHRLLHDEIHSAMSLCNQSLRCVLHLAPHYRTAYWEPYKLLRLLRYFPRDIIWKILEHACIQPLPTLEGIYKGARRVLRVCDYLQRVYLANQRRKHNHPNYDARAYLWDDELIDLLVTSPQFPEFHYLEYRNW